MSDRDCKHGQLARSCEICERDEIIKRLTVECEAWRSGRLLLREWPHDRTYYFDCKKCYLHPTIDAAVDALMGERGK